jgi:hypothetical protein
MMTNSVVPMPNEARARANKGRRLAEAGVLGARGMIALQQDDRCPARWTDEASHLHLCCLLPQALPSELEIVGVPAGTIKLPFRKLNSILCDQLGERASKATPKLCASMESATFKAQCLLLALRCRRCLANVRFACPRTDVPESRLLPHAARCRSPLHTIGTRLAATAAGEMTSISRGTRQRSV